MNQALHIFGKDMRHLRWEILLSLALVAAYGWAAPYDWRQHIGAVAGGSFESFAVAMSLAIGALTVLIPVSWWLLITRAVQTENLTGDQQWWVTKPYDWGSLLGAKLLFLALFVFAPIFVVQCLLLAQAGFHPSAALPALGLHLAIPGWIIVLPLLSIATVTSTIARSVLTVLALLLVIIAGLIGLGYVGPSGFDVPGTGWFAVLIAGTACAAIVLQYARRQVWKARLMMVAALGLMIATVFVPAASLLVNMVYRPANGPLQFALNPAGKSDAVGLGSRDLVMVSVPVKVSGIATHGGLVVEGVQAELEGSDGRRATTRWQSQSGGVYLVDTDPDSSAKIYLQLKRSFAEGEAEKPVRVHLRLAVAELSAGQPVQIAMPVHEFVVPGFGICTPAGFSASVLNNLNCYAAAQEPVKTLIRVQWSDTPCSTRGADSASVQGEGWAGSLDRNSELGLNPVLRAGFYLSNSYRMAGEAVAGPRFLCPGMPITFTPYRLLRRAEYDATFTNFVMPKEKQPQPSFHPHSMGIQVGF